MPCQSDQSVVPVQEEVQDWARIHDYTPARIYDPADRRQLVTAIVDGESRGGGMKAQGACYSLSKAQVADRSLIRTNDLDRFLGRAFSSGVDPRTPPANRFRKGHENDTLRLLPGLATANGSVCVYVEAGVQIKQLLVDLASMGLALPTMGSGGLQTLAGALSTGTHNADCVLPPLVDAVRAIHLVGPGGQEWWIEPSAGWVANEELTKLTDWCEGTRIVRDDEFFRAALVSVGRFGVIYGLVLEVPSQYWLREQSIKTTWTETAAILGRSAKPNGDYFADGAMFEGVDLRFCQLAVDLGRDVCWKTRRWLFRGVWTDASEKNLHEPTPGLIGTFCHQSSLFTPILVAMGPAYTALQGQVLAVPFAGIAWAARIEALRVQMLAWAEDSSTVGNFLSKMVKELTGLSEGEVGFVAPELKAIFKAIVGDLFDGEFGDERIGPSHKILDGHNYGRDGCMSANSCEFFFDAHDDQYLKFMSEVLAAARAGDYLPGYASLRFVQGSRALLAPEQYPLSVAIEIAVPRSTDDGDLYGKFFEDVLEIGRAHLGIPHWGQQMRLAPPRLEKLYGEKLEPWRWALAELEADRAPTFTSDFTRNVGLELDGKTIADYRSQRSGGVLASCVSLLGG